MKYLALLILCSCAQLTVHDFTACADKGPDGAHCDNYLADVPVNLDKPEWDALRGTGWLCVSPDDYGEIKIELEQACSVIKCTYQQKAQLQKFFSKMK